MISSISSQSTSVTYNKDNSSTVFDVHNISPRELAALTARMVENGEISLKEHFLFSLVDREKSLSKLLNREVRVPEWSKIFADPDTKRDMLAEYKNMLKEQSGSGANKELTKEAIALLERLAGNTNNTKSFEQILAEHRSSPS